MNQLSLFARPLQELVPEAVHVPDWLSVSEQRHLLALCREWAGSPAGLYTPKMLDGTPMKRPCGLPWLALVSLQILAP